MTYAAHSPSHVHLRVAVCELEAFELLELGPQVVIAVIRPPVVHSGVFNNRGVRMIEGA